MKKALVISLLLCGIIGLTSCGKSEKDEAVEFLQSEVGMSKEEANEFVEAFEEEEGESVEDAEETIQIELVSPSQSIINSKIGDPIAQVYNSVLTFDGTMTLDECVEKLEKENDLELNWDNSFGTPDESLKSGWTSSFSVEDQYGNPVCSLIGYNESATDKRLGDCVLIDVSGPVGNSQAALNFFYAGNICPGSFASNSKITSSEAYMERIKDYPALNADEVEPFFVSQGYVLAEGESWEDKKTDDVIKVYNKNIYSTLPVYVNEEGKKLYVHYTVYLKASTTTGKAIDYTRTAMETVDSSMIQFELTDLSMLDDDTKNTILESVVDTYLNDYWNTSAYFDNSAEVVGYYKSETDLYGKGTGFSFILKTDQGRYVETIVWADYGIDGDIVINSYEFYYGTSMYEVESLDEYLEKIGVSADCIMSL